MHLRRGVVFLGLWGAVAPPVRAQEWLPPFAQDSLLRSLAREALPRNPGLREAEAAFQAANARVRPAGALPDPMLEAGRMNLALPSFALGQSDFTEFDLVLRQDLPWPGTLGARTTAALATEAIGRAELLSRRREVVAAIAAGYYRMRYLMTALETLARQRRLLESAVEVSTTRYAAGSAPQADPLQAILALQRLASEAAAVRGDLAAVSAAVNALRDRAPSEVLAVAPLDSSGLRAHTTPLPGLDSLLGVALAGHPRVAAGRAALEYAASAVRLERLAGRPDFAFTLRYGYRSRVAGEPLPDFFSAALAVRLPIWTARKQRLLVAGARADSQAVASALRRVEVELTRQVAETAARAAAERRRLLLLVDSVLPTARATFDAVLRSYQVGRSEFVALVAAQDALLRTELEAAAVAAEHLTHLVVLSALTGEGIEP